MESTVLIYQEGRQQQDCFYQRMFEMIQSRLIMRPRLIMLLGIEIAFYQHGLPLKLIVLVFCFRAKIYWFRSNKISFFLFIAHKYFYLKKSSFVRTLFFQV